MAVLPPGTSSPANENADRDAICFTAGGRGIAFGAGVIHAHLAADREIPAVVAGISGGALNAAAMQRCYQELAAQHDGDTERVRWTWFRRYLDALCNDPLNLIWDGLPDQSDFFADLPPVKDPTPALFEDKEARRKFQELELGARRELYLYVRLGNWLARLPLKIGRITDVIVLWVRATEKYPGPRALRIAKFAWSALIATLVLMFHIAIHPAWFPEYKFAPRGWKRFVPIRPLFGWIWPLSVLFVSFFVWEAVIQFRHLFPYFGDVVARLRLVGVWLWSILDKPFQLQQDAKDLGSQFLHFLGNIKYLLVALISENRTTTLLIVGAVALAYIGMLVARSYLQRSSRLVFVISRALYALKRAFKFLRILKRIPGLLIYWASSGVALETHLVHDFHLRVRLTRLFGTKGASPKLSDWPMPAVLVAAPLQNLPAVKAGEQCWAGPDTSVVDALVASLAVPGLFPPLKLSVAESRRWIRPTVERGSVSMQQKVPEQIDLVDGAVIRKNPIPALFDYLDCYPELADLLLSTGDRPRLHVVHSHPTATSEARNTNAADIVDVGLKAMRLAERRDTEMEVKQTNFTSRIEQEIRYRTSTKSPKVRNIYADEISPSTDLKFKNDLSPSRDDVLGAIAEGCRRSLEHLYKNELVQINSAAPEIACSELLRVLSSRRKAGTGCASGLSEVCAVCKKQLKVETTVPRTASAPESSLVKAFPFLTGEEPRIIFLASGGVFRGPFQAGMLACLLTTQIRPQMIVGASVGTLMGGALGALLTVPSYYESLTLLGEIIDVFLHVDERIAFTKQFKSAARELGIRGRKVNLSPDKVRNLIRRGTRFDPGFAATGAPAALIDAISDFTMIPHLDTGQIAAMFLAGHISSATMRLKDGLKAETLLRLGIRDAVIGTSLLEPTARRLLGEQTGHINLKLQQPFRNIGFFATTTALMEEQCVILGRLNFDPHGSYDFVQAALASSAFPAVFAPRRQSDVFPEIGDANVLFSDGGMFDNLPYLPAFSVLAEIQREHSQTRGLDPIGYLRQRHNHPDLFLVGSLEVEAETDRSGDGSFNNLVAITKRAKLLENNVKIRAFRASSVRIHKQLDRLLDPRYLYKVPSDRKFIDGIVDAATLAVLPSDADHLNPTFAFCRSTGFKERRVQKSIADGCFQTFAKLVEAMGPVQSIGLARSMGGLLKSKRIPVIEWLHPDKATSRSGQCPFFRHSAMTRESQTEGRLVLRDHVANFSCPFHAASTTMSSANDDLHNSGGSSLAVFHQCVFDPLHKQIQRAAVQEVARTASFPAQTQVPSQAAVAGR